MNKKTETLVMIIGGCVVGPDIMLHAATYKSHGKMYLGKTYHEIKQYLKNNSIPAALLPAPKKEIRLTEKEKQKYSA